MTSSAAARTRTRSATELQRLGIPVVQGNWDEAVGMDRDQPGTLWPSSDAETAGLASLAWTREQVSDEHRRWLRPCR